MKPIHALLALLAYLLGRAHGSNRELMRRCEWLEAGAEWVDDDEEDRFTRMYGGE